MISYLADKNGEPLEHRYVLIPYKKIVYKNMVKKNEDLFIILCVFTNSVWKPSLSKLQVNYVGSTNHEILKLLN